MLFINNSPLVFGLPVLKIRIVVRIVFDSVLWITIHLYPISAHISQMGNH